MTDTSIYRRMEAMPWLRQLVSGFSHQMPKSSPSVIHVGFVGEQGFFWALQFPPSQLSFHQHSMFLLLCSGVPGYLIYRHTAGSVILLQGFCLYRITQRENADISQCQVVEDL
jgi:hypothetical protein